MKFDTYAVRDLIGEISMRSFGSNIKVECFVIDEGVPIEQLQQLLRCRKIDTSLQYAMVKQSNVKIAHRKYIG